MEANSGIENAPLSFLVLIAVAALNYFTEFDIGVAAIEFLAAIQLW